MINRTIGFAFVSLIVLTGTSNASVLPSIGTTTIVAENDLDTDIPGQYLDRTYDTSGSHSDTYRGGVSIVQANPATQSVRARATGAPGLGVVADVSMSYNFMFVGAPTSTVSPLVIGRAGSTGLGSYFDTFESISISSDAGQHTYYAGQNTGDPTIPEYVRFADRYTFTANVIYTVSLSATAYAGEGEASDAFADPYFDLTPEQARAFQLIFSPGIGNVAAVPLPGSAPMFGAALVAMGVASFGLRRRRRVEA